MNPVVAHIVVPSLKPDTPVARPVIDINLEEYDRLVCSKDQLTHELLLH